MNLFFQVFFTLNVVAIIFFLILYAMKAEAKMKSYRVKVYHEPGTFGYFYHDLVARNEREAYSRTKSLYPHNELGNVHELPDGTFNLRRNTNA